MFEGHSVICPPCFVAKQCHLILGMTPFPWLVFFLLVLMLGGCASNRIQYVSEVAVVEPPVSPDSFWNGDSMTGAPAIMIRLSEQKAYFYKGGQLAGICRISTGREGFQTATGNFRVMQKDKYHRSSLYGDYVDVHGLVVKKDADVTKDLKPPGTHFLGASMPNFMRIVGGTGLHTGYLPGYPASHGCIRMPHHWSEAFFRNVEIGTPVTVSP